MPQVRQITKTEMRDLYIKDLLSKIVNDGTRLYARSVAGMAEDPDGYEVVWCNL